ncbi:MAG: hypothetical protein IKE85_01485 [Mogibacterium sp.]|nr:hypothetical protein [Mogibacterium sp.]
MRHRKSAARVFIACMLTLCLIAGTLPFAEEANAASDYNTQTASPFSNAGKKLYTHNARFAGSLIVNGVDVSEWQHAGSKWNEAKAKGVDFAILRVSYTGTTSGKQYPDSNFAKFYTEAGAAGVMRGVYVFSQAKTDEEAINEAIYAVNCLHGLGITPKDLELPVYMDYEFSGPSSGASAGRLYGISKEQAMSCAKVFCQVIRAYGYQPGIYANTSFFRNYLDNGAGLEPDVDLWCAQYYSRCESGANYSKWQYSSSAYIGDKGKTNGILSYSTGKVSNTDVNFWYISKVPSAAPVTSIYGITDYAYTGLPVKPRFEIYDGATLLTEGVDYIVGGINNVNPSTTGAYAYIRGIGNYTGQALVPITIGQGYQAHIGLNGLVENGSLIFGNKRNMVTKYLVRFANEDGTQELSHAYYKPGTPAAEIVLPEAPVKAEDEENTYTFAGWTTVKGSAPEVVTDVQAGAVTYYATYTAVPKQTEPVPAEGTPEAAQPAPADPAAIAPAEGAAAPEAPVAPADPATAEPVPAEVQPSEAPVAAEPVPAEVPAAPEAALQPVPDTLEPLAESVTEAEGTVTNYLIGGNLYGSFFRGVAAGTTVAALKDGLETYKEGDSLTFEVINAAGQPQTPTAAVKTGMMLGVYRAGVLVGTADITVTGEELNRTAANYLTRQTIFSVMPELPAVKVKATSIKSLKKGSKSFTVKVKKLKKSQASGYQVRYGRNEDMSDAKIKTIGKKYNKVSKKITKLKKKKTYYVQVRTYKTVDGVKYYSEWSKTKKVKTK